VIDDEHEVAARATRMAVDGTVEAVDGTEVRVDARSMCVHGDTPGAVALARAVRTMLERADIRLGPFA
jgi:UPF0271 protein